MTDRFRRYISIERVVGDVRHALRTISRMPGVAAVVILSLGVGIGVNTAIFSWIEAMVLRPLPGVADAGAFLTVEPRSEAGTYPGVSWLEYGDLHESLRSFEDLLAFRMAPLNLGTADGTERVFGQLVSGNYFATLGLQPALGRFLQPRDVERPGAEAVVVISHDFWQTRYGGSTSALGQTLRVNERDVSIVGVAPRGFQGTVLMLDFDLWVPATMAPVLLAGSRELDDRSLRGYTALGKLRPDTTLQQAQAELDAAMEELALQFPQTNRALQGEVRPFWRAPRGPQEMMARALGILQAIMLLLLLAVCANTANLLLARGRTRQREIGVRLALGAGRWEVVRLLLTESLLMAVVGALLGAAMAVWGTEALRAVPLTDAFPIKFQTGVDAMGLGFAVSVGVVCGLAFGLAPALRLAGADPQRALHGGSLLQSRGTLRNALMGAQVALALIVLVIAAMFLQSFRETRETDPGFRREGVLLAAYDLSGRSLDGAAGRSFASRLLSRLRELPSVEEAAVASSVPLDIHGLPLRSFTLEGRARPDAAADQALNNIVTPGYFRTMGIPLRAGRDFADLDESTAAPQAIVNEAFVERYVEGAEPIGRRLQSGGGEYLIAGVVRDSLYESFSEPPTPVIYFSYRDRPRLAGEIHLRVRDGTETVLASEIERVVREIDPSLPVYNVRTLTEHVEQNLFLRRIPARMFAVLGPLLLVLAAIGIYAVVAYTVAQRTAEIGLRQALGATARLVERQIVSESLYTAAVGMLAGWLLSFAITRLPMLRSDYNAILVAVPATLLLVAAVAAWLPARRATRVDPVVALRQD